MKRIAYFITIVFIYAVIFGCQKNIPNEPATRQNSYNILAKTSTLAPGIADEFPVDLTPCVLDTPTLKTWSGNFLTHFQFSSPFTTSPSQSISASSLVSLFNSINIDGTVHPSHRYFRGLRIIYGATSDGTIKLIFVPVIADSTGTDSVANKTIFSVTPSATDIGGLSGNKIYICQDDGSLAEISQNDKLLGTAKDWITNYRTNIQIKPTDNASFRYQIAGTDANACFFPFQEIIELIQDNNASAINFRSIGKITLPDNIYRHDLALVPDVFYGTGSAVFTNMAADMGALCPPNCGAVNYSKSSF